MTVQDNSGPSNAPPGCPSHSVDGYALWYELQPGDKVNPVTGSPVDAPIPAGPRDVSNDPQHKWKNRLMYDGQTFANTDEVEKHKQMSAINEANEGEGSDQTLPLTHTPYGDGLMKAWRDMNSQNIHGAFALYQSAMFEYNSNRITVEDWMSYNSQMQMAMGGPEGMHRWVNLHGMGGVDPATGEQCGPAYNGSFNFATGVWYNPQGGTITVTMPTPPK